MALTMNPVESCGPKYQWWSQFSPTLQTGAAVPFMLAMAPGGILSPPALSANWPALGAFEQPATSMATRVKATRRRDIAPRRAGAAIAVVGADRRGRDSRNRFIVGP